MQQKNAYGMKLVAAAVSLVGALALLAFGTFAWFTTSTEGKVEGISVSFAGDGSQWPFEVSKDYGELGDDATWEKELNISDLMVNGLLRPISTADLEHWYLATYNGAGSVDGFREVALEDVANKADAEGGDTQNHLLYCDIYVRTRDPEITYALKLNNPATNADGSLHLNEDETVYGTYVLWTPVWNNESGAYSTADDAMASIRVGFQMFDQSDETAVANTVIYEPNADMHRGLFSEQDLVYVWDENGGTKIKDYNFNTVLKTKVPRYTKSGYELVDQPVDILQKTSAWKDELGSMSQLTQWDSTQIQSIGKFVDSQGAEIASGDLPALATIDKDHVQKIRIYFWLEGQDVDCWNQIAGGSIYANLEFRGDAVSVTPPSGAEGESNGNSAA